MRTLRRALVLGIALVAALAAPGAVRAQGAPADSLGLFLRGLAEATDAYFGPASVDFDTTGLDSLLVISWGEAGPRGKRLEISPSPVLRYHRAEGAVVGARARISGALPGVLTLGGAYGFANRGGRYEAGWRATLWRTGGPWPRGARLARGLIGEGARLDLELRYARQTLPFMPERGGVDFSGIGALLFGGNRRDVYERRGGEAVLMAWAGDWRIAGGFRRADERAMALATRFSLLGRRADVWPVAPAAGDAYSEALGGVAFSRPGWRTAGRLDARGGGADRWRLRAALGKSLRLPASWEALAQVEGGACAAAALRQRRFELGGPDAVPSLPEGTGWGDHLLVGRLDLVDGRDLLERLGVPHPDFLVLQPSVFVHGGAVWDDPGGRDIVFSKPPAAAWRGSAGAALLYRLGIPRADTYLKALAAWPIGRDAGAFRVHLFVGANFDLVGPL